MPARKIGAVVALRDVSNKDACKAAIELAQEHSGRLLFRKREIILDEGDFSGVRLGGERKRNVPWQLMRPIHPLLASVRFIGNTTPCEDLVDLAPSAQLLDNREHMDG